MDRRMRWAARILAAGVGLALAGCRGEPRDVYRRPQAATAAADPAADAAAASGADAAVPDGLQDPLAAQAFVLPGRATDTSESRARRRVEEGKAFYKEKIETARAYSAEGDDETALRVVASALALDPKSPW